MWIKDIIYISDISAFFTIRYFIEYCGDAESHTLIRFTVLPDPPRRILSAAQSKECSQVTSIMVSFSKMESVPM